jgi:hypothetical protein
MPPSKRSTPLKVLWPDPPDPPPARKKARKPKAAQAAGKEAVQPQRTADGSTETRRPIPVVPVGMTSWSPERIAKCNSVETLQARVLALEEHEIEIGLAVERLEDELKATQKRLKQLRDEKKRSPRKPRRPR